MTTKTKKTPLVMPLVDNPVTKRFVIHGTDSEIEVTISACPAQAVGYSFRWNKIPNGKIARCSGQVTLLRNGSGKSADTLATVRAISGGAVYAGPNSTHSLRGFQLHEVDDFDFAGRIDEAAVS